MCRFLVSVLVLVFLCLVFLFPADPVSLMPLAAAGVGRGLGFCGDFCYNGVYL